MLLSKKDYQKYIHSNKEKNKYIILYFFETLSNNQLDSLIEYAKKILKFNLVIHRNKNIKEIIYTPIEFINYLYYADLVIADTLI